jgi:hypothetical protein
LFIDTDRIKDIVDAMMGGVNPVLPENQYPQSRRGGDPHCILLKIILKSLSSLLWLQ